MQKILFIRTDQGRCFEIDLHEICRDRANFYKRAGFDFVKEYNHSMNSNDVAVKWLKNNMAFHLCESLREVTKKTDISELKIESWDIINKE